MTVILDCLAAFEDTGEFVFGCIGIFEGKARSGAEECQCEFVFLAAPAF